MVETKLSSKDYLLQVYYTVESIKYKNKELEKLINRQAPKDVSVPELDRVGGFSRNLKSAGTVCNEIIELQEEIMRLKEKVSEAIEKINKVYPPQCKTVLMYRYIKGMRWSEIAGLMGFTERQVYNLNIKAIKIFHEIS